MDEISIVSSLTWDGRLSYLFSDGTVLPAIRGGAGDENDTGDDDSGDDDESDDDDDDSEDESTDKSKEKIRDPKRKDLSAENARRRRLLREERQKREAAEQELATLKGKDKPDLERLTTERNEAVTRAEKAEEAMAVGSLQVSLLFGFLSNEGDPKKIQKAVKLLMADREKFEADGEGGWEGIEEALEDLFDEFPEFKTVTTKSKDEDDEDEDDEEAPKSKPKSSSGKPMNGRKKSSTGHDLASLAKRFPAMSRR